MPKSHPEVLVPMQRITPDWSMRWQLMCPACGAGEVENVDYAPDHEAVTVHPDRDEYDSPIGTRGGYVRVDLECSAGGHGFALIVGNHKGAEFVGVVPRVRDQEDG
ncbi:hypothetical protein [Streptomyces chattanoogensis]|uniref:hypothetical protein n=1 Tax=Streptomyces chattanoogensis TaxID=66876 RepID=UPI00369B68C3